MTHINDSATGADGSMAMNSMSMDMGGSDQDKDGVRAIVLQLEQMRAQCQ